MLNEGEELRVFMFVSIHLTYPISHIPLFLFLLLLFSVASKLHVCFILFHF